MPTPEEKAAAKAAADKAKQEKAAEEKAAPEEIEAPKAPEKTELQRIFACYPKEQCVWQTEDGQYFLSQLEALNHTKNELKKGADTIKCHDR